MSRYTHVAHFATAVAVSICAAGAGCAPGTVARQPNTPVSSSVVQRAPLTVAVPRTVVTPNDAASVDEIFARAETDFAGRRFESAASGFDRVASLDPEGPHAMAALFDGAAAHDELGDLDGAQSRYIEVARRYPTDRFARESLVRTVRLLTELEQWSRAGEVADQLLARLAELSPLERIVAYSGKALSLVFSSDPESAAYFMDKARDIVDAERLDSAGALPRDLARLYFALGELRRIRGQKIQFVPTPPNFADVLEARCQLLLDAQSAYSDAMRAYDAHWSAMAGFRVGELYQTLHDDLMRITPPHTANTEAKRQLFVGAMQLRYEILLEKGLTMMEHTVSLGNRTGESSEWVRRAAEAKRALTEDVQKEQEALARLPFSKEALERALSEVGRRHAGTRIPAAPGPAPPRTRAP